MPSIYPVSPLNISGGPGNPVSGGDASESKWASLFSPPESKSQAVPDDIKSKIGELKGLAQGGNEEAVDLLLNLAGGLSSAVVAREAGQAIADLCSDMSLASHHRQSILESCVALYDRVIAGPPKGKAESKQSGAGSSRWQAWTPSRVRPEVLYLAQAHLHMSGSPSRPHLSAHFDAAMGDLAAGRAESKSASGEARGTSALKLGRSVTNDEVIAAGQSLKSLGFAQNTGGVGGQQGAITEAIYSVNQTGKPRALFYNTGGHWVAMIACKNAANEVCGLVFDSKPDPRAEQVQPAAGPSSPAPVTRQGALEKAFTGGGGASLTYIAKPFQDKGQATPSALDAACGPLAMLAFRALDAHLAQGGGSTLNLLEKALKTWADEWSALDDAEQQRIVFAQRASMLGALTN